MVSVAGLIRAPHFKLKLQLKSTFYLKFREKPLLY